MEQLNDVGTIKDLCLYRIELARNDLKSAKLLSKNNDYRGANNRAYYSIFHAINAVHALDGKSYKRHKDALANFNKDYVKTEIFDKSLGRKISDAEEIRHASDYDDFYIATIEDAKKQIESAELFLEQVEEYCVKRIEKEKNNKEYIEKLEKSIEEAKRGQVVEKTISELEALADE